MSERTIGWLLDESDRAALIERFPPRWPDVIAHHVTLASKTSAPLPARTTGQIVGHVDDGKGLEALVVAIGGATDRPDGSTWHITWSLDRASGREAIQSNDVLREMGWEPIAAPIAVDLRPAEFS